MKTCSKCFVLKPLDSFYIRANKVTHNWCKECNKDHAKRRQRELKRQCVAYKGGSCVDCGRTGHQSIFDFHHLDHTQKDFTFANLKSTTMNKTIEAELDKCVLLCACCHRLRHYDL